MIIQALVEYHDRRAALGGADVAPPGFEWKEIPFLLEITPDGALVQIEDTRSQEGKKKPRARKFLVPTAIKRTVKVSANLLWDSAEYVLGVVCRSAPERVAQQHAAFRARMDTDIEQSGDIPAIRAIRRFLEYNQIPALQKSPYWPEILENPFMSFRVAGDPVAVVEDPAVVSAIRMENAPVSADGPSGFCLATGEPGPPARLHPAIKGVWGAQTAGANIVSFNLPAFNSYGKEQGANAPIGERAAEAYTKAINLLLARDSAQRVQLGDAAVIFWAARQDASEFERQVAALLGEPTADDPDRNTLAVRGLLSAWRSGAWPPPGGDSRFYVLGLAPNAARIAVRFWKEGTVGELGERLARHFAGLEINPDREGGREHVSQQALLRDLAPQQKSENLPPRLTDDLLRAAFDGTPYPASLANAAIRRIRAEQRVTQPRAAILKAYLNRLRKTNDPEKELDVSLDKDNPNPAYRLGRLFAVFERIQYEAQGELNANIRDKYYGSASANPSYVFPILDRLKNHHLKAIQNRGRATNLEKLVGEIIDGLDAQQPFPRTLSLENQGRFAVGYYHQRRHASTYKSESTEE